MSQKNCEFSNQFVKYIQAYRNGSVDIYLTEEIKRLANINSMNFSFMKHIYKTALSFRDKRKLNLKMN